MRGRKKAQSKKKEEIFSRADVRDADRGNGQTVGRVRAREGMKIIIVARAQGHRGRKDEEGTEGRHTKGREFVICKASPFRGKVLARIFGWGDIFAPLPREGILKYCRATCHLISLQRILNLLSW